MIGSLRFCILFIVRDVAKAKAFCALLGYVEDKSVVISGAPFATYMGVEGIEAEPVTLMSPEATRRFENQLLRYIRPPQMPPWTSRTLRSPATITYTRWNAGRRN